MVFVRETSSWASGVVRRVFTAILIAFGFIYILIGRTPHVPFVGDVRASDRNVAHADAPACTSDSTSCGDSTDCSCGSACY